MESSTASPEDITLWLGQLDNDRDGGGDARGITVNRPFAALSGELKRSAHAQMRNEHLGHTLSATALTHEAWFRLTEQTRTQWKSRNHFVGRAAFMMRRILVNHAVTKHAAKQAVKRDVPLVSLILTEAQQITGGASTEVVKDHDFGAGV